MTSRAIARTGILLFSIAVLSAIPFKSRATAQQSGACTTTAVTAGDIRKQITDNGSPFYNWSGHFELDVLFACSAGTTSNCKVCGKWLLYERKFSDYIGIWYWDQIYEGGHVSPNGDCGTLTNAGTPYMNYSALNNDTDFKVEYYTFTPGAGENCPGTSGVEGYTLKKTTTFRTGISRPPSSGS